MRSAANSCVTSGSDLQRIAKTCGRPLARGSSHPLASARTDPIRLVFNGLAAAVVQQPPGMSGAGLVLSPVQSAGADASQDVAVGQRDIDAERPGQDGGGVRPALIRRVPRSDSLRGCLQSPRRPSASARVASPRGGCPPVGGRCRSRPAWRRDCPLRPGGNVPGPRPVRRATPRAGRP